MKRTSGTEKNFVMGIKSNYSTSITNWFKCSGLLLALLLCLNNSEMRANNFVSGINAEEISGIDLDWDFSDADQNLFQEYLKIMELILVSKCTHLDILWH